MEDTNTTQKHGLEDNFGRDDLSIVDDSVVFSVSKNHESHRHRHRSRSSKGSKNKKIILAIIAVLAACVIAVVVFIVVSRQDNSGSRKRSPAANATLDEALSTEPLPSGVVSGTGIAGVLSREEILMDYAQKNNIISVLEAQADGNMSVTVTADKNALIARYSVRGSSQDANMREYFSALPQVLEELCLRMNGTVRAMRQDSGVPNALLYIGAVDQNGVTVYSQKVTGTPIQPTTEATTAPEQTTTVAPTVQVRRSTNGRPPVPTRSSSNGTPSATTQPPNSTAN